MKPVSKEYKIGQILYVVPGGKRAVIPVQVVEEITKKTLQGHSVSYIIRFGEGTKVLKLEDVVGEVFESPDMVKNTLERRMVQALNKLVDDAVRKAKAWYEPPAEQDEAPDGLLTTRPPADQEGQSQSEDDEEDGTAKVVLEDGTVARVRLPPEVQG